MKKLLLFILIVVAVAGVCVVTCPDKEAHSEALKDLVNTVLTEELAEGEKRNRRRICGIRVNVGNRHRWNCTRQHAESRKSLCLQRGDHHVRRKDQNRFYRHLESRIHCRQRRLQAGT